MKEFSREIYVFTFFKRCLPVLVAFFISASHSAIGAAPSPVDIFTSAPFPQCHASTVVELTNGDWLAAWFGGAGEGKPDVAIWGARHTSAGWGKPFVLEREPNVPTWNPVLFHTGGGLLWLYYKIGPTIPDWVAARVFSSDDGRTWSPPEYLTAGLLGPIRAKPLVMQDGTVVSGSSVESYHSWAVWIERSTDAGIHFVKHGPYTLTADQIHSLAKSALNGGNKEIGSTAFDQTTGLIQPSVLSVSGKHLRFYARSSSNIGRICISDSEDGGISWSPPHPTDLPNPNSGIDIVHLSDGRYVLIYNPTTTGRSPLTLAVSSDGIVFNNFETLEEEPGAEFSYPALIQLKNGDLLATYTWHRTRIRSVLIPRIYIP